MQYDLFNFPKYKITKPIRLIELFAGVGSQAMALRNIGVTFESWYVCEFDKYAIKSYNAIHNTNYPVSDVTKIHASDLNITDRDKYEYILTYSFPCTDLSVAGKMAGMKKGSGTRSGLLWEVERLLNECSADLPQVLLMENVPQVKTAEGFEDWLNFLTSKGYQNYYKILNAKNFGVAQNRERCFMISFLSSDYKEYDFPEEVKLNKCILDYLEENVDEKYYIKSEKAKKLIIELQEKDSFVAGNVHPSTHGINGNVYAGKLAPTLTTNKGEGPKMLIPECINLYKDDGKETSFQNRIYKADTVTPAITTNFRPYYLVNEEKKSALVLAGNMNNKEDHTHESANRVYKINGISPALNTCGGGNLEPKVLVCAQRGRENGQQLEPNYTGCTNTLTTVQKDNLVLIKQATKEGFAKCKVPGIADLSFSSSSTRRGRVQNEGRVSPTLTTSPEEINVIENIYRIRKLTPRECWRLMGFTDIDYDKAKNAGVSNSQLYKQAGNSIVVPVLENIFKNLF